MGERPNSPAVTSVPFSCRLPDTTSGNTPPCSSLISRLGACRCLGITDDAFMRQVVRILTMADVDPCRVLICDRDTKWSAAVRERLDEAGMRVVQTPYQAPNADAHAERFVRSIKEECLNRIIPFGERHLRRAVNEYVTHYHLERNHQGLGNALIDGVGARSVGAIRRHPRLGGLLNYYDRAA